MSLQIGDDVEAMIEARKPAMAFTLGGMGSAKTNWSEGIDSLGQALDLVKGGIAP